MTSTPLPSSISDFDDEPLAAQGAARVEWVRSRMPLLAATRAELAETKPFSGHRIGMSLHLEPKTAVFVETLAAGGAELVGTGNYGSTQDDIAAFLNTKSGVTIFGRRDDTVSQHQANIAAVLDSKPSLLMDNGADLVAGVIERGETASVVGGTEETTSGAHRLRGDLVDGFSFPVIVVNDSLLKAVGENQHSVGQAVVESFMRITNLMIPGRRFVVVGYGWCGRGVAQYFRALGGKVAVVEIDEIKAFEAAFDGFRVGTADDFAAWGDVFVTATGFPHVLPAAVIQKMQPGAVLANCGHFPYEIDVVGLREIATGSTEILDAVERVDLPGGGHVILIADGRMMNLAGTAPKGNSLESMDLGFLLETLSLERVATRSEELSPGAQPVPDDIDRSIARRLLASLRSTE